MQLSPQDVKDLELKANEVRVDIIKMLVEAGSGHSGGPLGLADIFTALFFKELNINPEKPDWEDRDRFVLSCGHTCPVMYATMAHRGFFPVSELKTLRKLGSRLQGHPHREALPGLETTSGPLGSGLSQAAGMALAGIMDKKSWRVYCITSDGEHQEGNTWEAIMFAANYKLGNLTAIMDRNNMQIDGHTEDIMQLNPVAEKYRAFNWNVIEVNGHNFQEIMDACEFAKTVYDKPTMIIAHTIPGKGVSYMENRYEWHGAPPDGMDIEGAPAKGEQAKEALKQLEGLERSLKNE
jgi:transketolase